jgi:cell division septal protein FtsQ
MRHLIVLLAVALAALTVVRPIPAQKFLPKSVQFKGDPEYTDQELMDAAGLKKGVVLDSEALNDASQRWLWVRFGSRPGRPRSTTAPRRL